METSLSYSRGRAWTLLAFLVVLNALNFLDRTLPQAFIVDITTELGLNYTTFTLLNGLLFAVIYAVTGVAAGALADRVARPRLIAAGVALWSIMTAATGLVQNVVQYAGARAAVAIGEASLSPAALSMLSGVFPRAQHGLAASLYYLGISIGAGGAFVIAGSLGAAVGWRACFFILGGVGVALSLLSLLYSDPRQKDGVQLSSAKSVRRNAGIAIAALTRSPALGGLWLAAVLISFSQGASVLDQAWLVRELGFSKSEAQSLVGLVFTGGSLCGALFGGMLADAFAARWRAGRLYYIVTMLAVLAPAGLVLRFCDPTSPAFVILLFAGSAGFTLFYGAILASVQDLVDVQSRATIIALTLLGTSVFGIAFGGVFAGFLADCFGALSLQAPLRAATFVTQCVAFLALPCLVMAARSYRSADALP